MQTIAFTVRRWHSIIVLTALVGLLAATEPAIAGDLPPGWLDVRDCGASGSMYQTTAATADGSNQITVAHIGDFKAGQGVMLSGCNIRYTPMLMWGTGERYRNSKPAGNSVEVRGYDGAAGSWMIYVLDIAPSPVPAFRWSDDLGRTWHPAQAITHGWQELASGVQVRLNQRDWESGYVISFGARDQLVTRIEKIEGNVLTLHDPANRATKNAILRHNDTLALQAAVDRALKEKLKVYVPVGHYRLAHGIRVESPAAMTIEGASAVDSVLDISEGEGRCITIEGGTEATIRNLSFIGFMGFDERDKAGELRTLGSTAVWGFALKPCHAMDIVNTERVLVENCHASRMSGECFVSSSRSRSAGPAKGSNYGGFVNPSVAADPATAATDQPYCHGTTYLRCSVTDCARNAFNDVLCGGEFTAVQNCRIVDVGGNAWEGASRFVKFTGNYVRNAGTVGIGNLGPANRDATYPDLGAGQIVVADNVFEANTPYGLCAVRTARGATQVIIRNNLFINFGSSGVEAGGWGLPNEYPSANTTIAGNIFDMTTLDRKPLARTAINISANDTIVGDNQIYVRGAADPTVTAIKLREPALNATIHDNLVRNCGVGIVCDSTTSAVGQKIDDTTFAAGPGSVPIGWQPHLYRGWGLDWLRDGKPFDSSEIDYFDPPTSRFKLKRPRDTKPGDHFGVYSRSANWNIHDNTLVGCLRPVVLDAHGSPTSILKDNAISRGDAPSTTQAIEHIRGQFELIGNRISDFAEAQSSSQTPAKASEPSAAPARN